jgi:hypothetical protein
MKHNKKRNTAFLYECLLREGTKAAFDKNLEKAKIIKNIILEHFNKNTEVFKELELYNSLKENSVEEEIAEKYLQEIKSRYEKINKNSLFNEQTILINKINKSLGTSFYNNFVPNYKDLATIFQIFNDSTPPKEKILLERTVLEKIKISDTIKKTNILEHSDNLLFKTFSKKFNEKYTSLLNEQKVLLSKYVNSFNNNGLDFKIYLNEEVERLKIQLNEMLKTEEIKTDLSMTKKTQETINFLEDFKTIKSLNQEVLQKILKIQQLVHEVNN